MSSNQGGRFGGIVGRAGSLRWRSSGLLPILVLVIGLAATSVEAYRQRDVAIEAWNGESFRAFQLVALANHDAAERANHELTTANDALTPGVTVLGSGEAPAAAAAAVADAVDRTELPALIGVLAYRDGVATTLAVGPTTDVASLANPSVRDQLVSTITSSSGSSLTMIETTDITVIGRKATDGGVALLMDPALFPTVNGSTVAGTITTAVVRSAQTESVDGELTRVSEVSVGDVALTVSSTLPDGLPEKPRPLDLLVLVIGGSLLSVAGAGLARSLLSARARTAAVAGEATEAQQAAAVRLRRTFESSPIGMAEIDKRGHFVQVNPALGRQLGRTPPAMIGSSVTTIIHPDDLTRYLQKLAAVLQGRKVVARSEHRYRRSDGTAVWVDESLTAITDDAGAVDALLLQAQDVTARREAVSELAWQAFHDELTGLPNRALFLNRLRNALDRVSRQSGIVAVMFVDIDRFKIVNDSLGHKAGDRLLKEVSGRLGTAVRVGDTVARFGGDEFVVLCESVASASEALWIGQRIQQSLLDRFECLDGLPGTGAATASIGITLCMGPDEGSAEDLLRDADAAMYRAKERGRNRIEIFDTSLRHQAIARLEIESQLRDALDNGDMVLHYQAIVDSNTELPVGYEALIRWHHPEKGLLGPSAFLPVAEEAGVMHHIDSWTLRQTCLQIAEWNRLFPQFQDLYVSTNWSARHLGQFVQLVEQVVPEAGIIPSQLLIEVTEGFLLEDTDGTMDAIRRLKQLGVGVAIDDFGTGYSSLSYLTRLEVDYLKIDKSFVFRLPDPAAEAVVGAIADMAGRLGIGIIAEGVETDEQLHFLAGLGPIRLQGYRFSKPRWAAEITDSLEIRFNRASELTSLTSLN